MAGSTKIALKGIEAVRADRLRTLGVRANAIAASAVTAPLASKATEAHLRLLQWNILADGLADDGFLVTDILADWPVGEGMLPDSSGAALGLVEVAQQLASAQGQPPEQREATLKAFADRFDTPASRANLSAVVDCQARLARIEAEIVAADADIVALQELDHFVELGQRLARHGYECGFEGAFGKYKPAHLAELPLGDINAYLGHLRDGGVAFAPNLPSNARRFAMKRGRGEADDDGVALFWKSGVFELHRLEFLAFEGSASAKKAKGIVKAVLARRTQGTGRKTMPGDGDQVHIIAAHLASGDSVEEETERLEKELFGSAQVLTTSTQAPEHCAGLREWFAASVAKAPTLLSLDANATPEIRAELGMLAPSVWSTLHSVGGVASVWDRWYESSGIVRANAPRPIPVSTNKLRGPLSAQPRKIGLHAHYLIDHIYFGTSWLNHVAHVRPPLGHATAEEALSSLLPTLCNPSDHVPVIVDFAILPGPTKGPALGRHLPVGWPVLFMVSVCVAVTLKLLL
mmetsp:Transcript_261/g.608  ORF Transcript_261/g.608 Transcript_261/m.608 type:complete len:518 (+) Transcript_261:122-1675(+)